MESEVVPDKVRSDRDVTDGTVVISVFGSAGVSTAGSIVGKISVTAYNKLPPGAYYSEGYTHVNHSV